MGCEQSSGGESLSLSLCCTYLPTGFRIIQSTRSQRRNSFIQFLNFLYFSRFGVMGFLQEQRQRLVCWHGWGVIMPVWFSGYSSSDFSINFMYWTYGLVFFMLCPFYGWNQIDLHVHTQYACKLDDELVFFHGKSPHLRSYKWIFRNLLLNVLGQTFDRTLLNFQ